MRPGPRLAVAAAVVAAVAAAVIGKPQAAPIQQLHAGRVHETLPVFLWEVLSVVSS